MSDKNKCQSEPSTMAKTFSCNTAFRLKKKKNTNKPLILYHTPNLSHYSPVSGQENTRHRRVTSSSGEIQEWNFLRDKKGWAFAVSFCHTSSVRTLPSYLNQRAQTSSALPLLAPGFPLCVCPHAAHRACIEVSQDRAGLPQEHEYPSGRWGLASSQSFG